MMEKNKVITTLINFPLVPVFNSESADETLDIISACYNGGVRVFEFTNRNSNALAVFKQIKPKIADQFPDLILGVGTILDVDAATSFYSAGADFIVQPITDFQVGQFCLEKNLAWLPGCGSLTEIVNAQRAGAEVVKLFPGDLFGPEYVKAALGPLKGAKIMVTGGVVPEPENIKTWFKAGVSALGMGSQLFKDSDREKISQKLRLCFSAIKN